MRHLLIKTVSVNLILISGLMACNSTQKDNNNGNEGDSKGSQDHTEVKLPEVPDTLDAKVKAKPKRVKLDAASVQRKPKKRSVSVKRKEDVPDFNTIDDVSQRKQEFVSFLKPIVREANQDIIETRGEIKALYNQHQKGRKLSKKDLAWLDSLARVYRVKNPNWETKDSYTALLLKVDIIPMELAIIQGANESAWGTSFFAQKGNNLFGKWCFKPGCGIVPRKRASGSTHEVAAYASPLESVKDYMHHINSHPGYRQLRVLRYEARKAGKNPEGANIAAGLTKYSAKGQEYVNILRQMIKQHQTLIDA